MSGLTDQLTVNYRPPGPVSRAFLESNAFVRGIRGPFGSGKSTVCCVDILDHMVRQKPAADGKRYSRHAIIRQTYPELKTTTIKTWHDIVSPRLGRWIDQGPPTHIFSADDIEAEVMFLALDSPQDVKKLLSMDLTTAWINEGREAPKAVLDGLTARVGRYPPQAMGGPSWFGVTMDTNPPDADHWWYRLAEEQRPDGYEFFAQPSGLSPNAENILNLPPGYYERMCQGKSADWIKVYVKGEYGFVLDGRPVFPEYNDSVHCQAFDLNPRLSLYLGIDFGLTPAAAIGQKDAVGRWRWRYELTTEHMGAKRFGEELAKFIAEKIPTYKFEAITGDPAGTGESQADESTPFDMLKLSKIDARPAYTNDPTIRRESVAAPLGRLIDGQPGFLIHPDMKVARKGFQGGYQYRRVQIAGDERYHDRPDKNLYSHICEAIEYGSIGGGEGKALVQRERKGPRPRYALT
ncbi:MAG: TerL [Pseudomonadota bacterium]